MCAIGRLPPGGFAKGCSGYTHRKWVVALRITAHDRFVQASYIGIAPAPGSREAAWNGVHVTRIPASHEWGGLERVRPFVILGGGRWQVLHYASSVIVDRPPDVVFQFLVDPERQQLWSD